MTDLNKCKIVENLEDLTNNFSVSNREQLQETIHEIHNYLRNNGAGYGMNALKVFNLIYGLKKITDANLLEISGLSEACNYNKLLDLAAVDGDENILTDYILNNILNEIHKSKLKDFLFYEIPKEIKSEIFKNLINKIEKISQIEKSQNMQLSGKIYEYFIGRDETAISELGAYFTDRHIVNYIYEKLVKLDSLNDNNIPTMIDPFGGSGGFTTGFIMYLQKKFKNINWNEQLSKINHFDINEDVIKSAALEFFCLTGEIPDVKKNMKYHNAFKDSFNKKYHYVITNPPYGGDKCNKSDASKKRDKIISHIENELEKIALYNYEENENIPHGTTTINEVIKCINGKKTTKTRFIRLYTNKNDQIIIGDNSISVKRSCEQLEFMKKKNREEKLEQDNVKVKIDTCSDNIIDFAKKYELTGNDKESCSLILMMDLLEKNGTAIGVLKEGVFFNRTYKSLRKCLIKNFNVRKIVSVPSSEFENTSTKTSIIVFDNTDKKTSQIQFYDLNVNKYKNNKIDIIDGVFQLTENTDDIYSVTDTLISTVSRKKLLENKIYSFNGKDYIKQNMVASDGYKLVRLGDICEFKPKSKRKASYGKENGKINFYTSSDKVKKCDIADYNEELILIGTGGNSCIHINNQFSCSGDLLIFNSKINNNYIYYVLKSLWKILLDKMHGSTINHVTKTMLKDFTISIPQNKSKIEEWTKKISKPYNKKLEKENELKELEAEIEERVKDICENADCKLVKLGDICEIKYGKRITKTKNEGSQYEAYGGGGIMTYKVNNYNRDGITYKISRDGISLNNCVSRIYGKIFLNDTALTLNSLNKNISNNYIGEYLLAQKNNIYKNCTRGSAQLHINIDKLIKLKIKIPKNKELIKKLEPKFSKVETLQQEIKKADELYNKYIKQLGDKAIKSDDSLELIENESDEEIFEIKKPSKKISKQNTKKKVKNKQINI